MWKKLFITATSLTDFSPQIDKISSILNDELHKCPTKRTTPQCAHSIPNCAAFRKLPIQGFLLLIAQDKLPTLDVSLLRRLVCLHIDERENIFFYIYIEGRYCINAFTYSSFSLQKPNFDINARVFSVVNRERLDTEFECCTNTSKEDIERWDRRKEKTYYFNKCKKKNTVEKSCQKEFYLWSIAYRKYIFTLYRKCCSTEIADAGFIFQVIISTKAN